MWHLLMAHQQESFLPFSSRQSLSCCLSCVAKRSTPKPRGPLYSPSEPHGPLSSSRTVWPSPSEPHGPPPHFRTMWPSPPVAAVPRFKSQHPSSFAAPFLTPSPVSYTCLHPRILPALLGCHLSLGRCGPMAWSQSSPSSHAGPVTRGSCFPVPAWVEVTPIPLAQSWPQLFNISMKPVKGYRYVK